MQYYIRIRGKIFGPFGENQLKEMRVKGKLNQTTEVSENKIDWQPISELTFLFQPLSISLEITSSEISISPDIISQDMTTQDTTTRFRTKLPFIAICFFLILIIAASGLVGFIFLNKGKDKVTSSDSKKHSQEEQQTIEKKEQKHEETVYDDLEQNNILP
ncbi:MAG: DUF4339 domain-containing protein [Planctomycetaceae bacterium]|jgi:hypothetical protein|nr:DUF4339 domain-containing protein [Planctomycetaceae bacterium]